MAAVSDKEREYGYFLYSSAQHKMRNQIEERLGKKFIPGKVLVNGNWKQFTQISKTPDNKMYGDAKLVAQGYLDSMKYQNCSNKWKVQP